MYLSGTIGIDPSQLTEIVKVKPTKAFAKMAYYLSGTLATKKEEIETFTGVSILQQVNMVLRSIGVTNIIRLAKDDEVLYEDLEGREDDLKDALAKFTGSEGQPQSPVFNELTLVLEHATEGLQLLIDIRIRRAHTVGEDPIMMTVNGLINEFKAKHGEAADDLRARMKDSFASQDAYDALVKRAKTAFDSFLEGIEFGIRKHMQVDQVRRHSKVKIIRAKDKPASSNSIRHHDRGDPVYYGYYDYDDYFYYSWYWSDMCHDYDITCIDCALTDDEGYDVMEIGDEGVDMGEQDVSTLGDAEAVSAVAASDAADSGGGGWLSDVFSGGGGDSSSGGDSSCGSCSGE